MDTPESKTIVRIEEGADSYNAFMNAVAEVTKAHGEGVVLGYFVIAQVLVGEDTVRQVASSGLASHIDPVTFFGRAIQCVGDSYKSYVTEREKQQNEDSTKH